MKEFMFIFRGGDSRDANQSPEQMQAHMQRWMTWMDSLAKKGQLIAGQPLNKEGKVLKGTAKKVTDGPFMEGKEIVGGYLLVKVSDLKEATELAKGCPILEFDSGIVEVREIMPLPTN